MRRSLPFFLAALAAQSGFKGFKKAVAGGERHYPLLQDDGTLLGFGDSRFGSLGVAEAITIMKPRTVPLPAPAIDIAASRMASFAVLNDGSVYSWGARTRTTCRAGRCPA